MKNTKIIVKTKSKSYPVYFGDGILNTAGTLINKNLPNVKKICIIFDKNLPLVLIKKLSKSLRKYNLKFYRLPAREKTKSFKVAEKIPRCSATNLVPNSDVVDINLPKKLREIYGHINMGIYLKPLTDGKINISDQIKIIT